MEAKPDTINTETRLGSLLVKEGFVTEEDIEKALEIQKKDADEVKMPFSMILVNKGFLTKQDIDRLMVHPEIQKDIEALILEQGLINQQKLFDCLGKKQEKEQIGDVLVKEGCIGNDELNMVLNKELDGIKLGKLALNLSMITERELEEALRFKRYKRAIGEILCDLSLLTLSELNLVFQKYNKRLKLGEILIQQEIVDKETLEKALQEQKVNGETLGKVLVRKGLVTVDQLHFALSVQYNIPFHDLEGFVFYEKQKIALRDIVGRKYAEENLVLPLFLNGNNLTVAVSNPSREWVAHELRSKYNHLRISCVLISDEKFEQLFAILYGEMLDTSKELSKDEKQYVSNNGKSIISDLEKDGTVIDNLYEQYKMLRENTGKKITSSDASHFREFIEDNFRDICLKFHCRSVSFYVEARSDQVEILAAPLIENISVPNPKSTNEEASWQG
jgi:hypothetical protein